MIPTDIYDGQLCNNKKQLLAANHSCKALHAIAGILNTSLIDAAFQKFENNIEIPYSRLFNKIREPITSFTTRVEK